MMFDKEYSFRGKHAEYVVKLTAEVTVKNTSEVDGEIIVQMYVLVV